MLDMSSGPGVNTQYSLAVWWKGDDDLEYFTLKCRNEEQMRKWESQINRLIKENAQRRGSDRGLARLNGKLAPPSSRSAVSVGNSSTYSYNSSTSHGSSSTALSTASTSTKITRNQPSSGSGYSDSHDSINAYPTGPSSYGPDGFTDDDDCEDFPPILMSSHMSSGRGTPIYPLRKLSSLSLPSEQREAVHDQRVRAYTEDFDGTTMTQWRNQAPTPQQQQLATHPLGGVQRPSTPRTQSDALSIGQRPHLRSQFSSSRLRTGHESGEARHNRAPTPTHPQQQLKQQYLPQPVQSSRSRSASQPSTYIPQQGVLPPPLPVTHATNWTSRDHEPTSKRGSGSSQSTADSSEYSPNSSSPVTSYGSSESSLTGVGIGIHANGQELRLPPVKVKVYFRDDIFVIQVPRSTEYDDLVDKVGKKIRLCGPRRDDMPLRVKYRDEDGDMVSLGSTEDVQIAFESYRPGGQVTLFVT